MSEKNKQGMTELPSLEQVVRQIDKSLLNIDDSQALRLGLAAIAGSSPSTKGERYILFSLGGISMAVPITGVVEVTDLPSITKLPHVPSWVLGIVNVRSEIISVIDLPLFCNWDVQDAQEGTSMIILGYRGVKTGIRIDKIVGTLNSDEASGPAPDKQLVDSKIFGLLSVDGHDYYSVDYRGLLGDDRFLKLTP